MWSIEMLYRFTSGVSIMLFDTEDEAKAERDKIIGYMGKDSYDLKKNGALDAITLTDKYGTLHVVPSEVKSLRMYNRDDWDRTIIKERIRQKALKKELGDDTDSKEPI